MKNIISIAKKIKENGGDLYLVGGAIRNKLLNLQVKDEDYCVTGISKEKFLEIFPKAKMQGKEFPVFIMQGNEFALARKERKIGIGHKNFEFDTNINITIEEDLRRRDITINSIAQRVLTGEIIDPYKGIEDIKNRIIRKTSNAFKEDPLRVYRVARFAAVLNFEVEQETIKEMNKIKKELETLSKERVFIEFKKSLESNQPSMFFNVLRRAKILDVHFEEFSKLIEKTKKGKYHLVEDIYDNTMVSVDNSTKLTNDLKIRFSCLVHDIDEGVVLQKKLQNNYEYDEKRNELVEKFGRRIGVPHNWINCGKVACKWYKKAEMFEKMKPNKKIELIEKVERSVLKLEGLKTVVACDKTKIEDKKELEVNLQNIKFDKIGKECMKEINGKNIIKKYPYIQGKQISEKLHENRIKWIKSIDRK